MKTAVDVVNTYMNVHKAALWCFERLGLEGRDWTWNIVGSRNIDAIIARFEFEDSDTAVQFKLTFA